MGLSSEAMSGFVSPVQAERFPLSDRGSVAHGSAQYEVKLAQPHEFDELFSLRYDIFLASNDAHPATMRDVDQYDDLADHLIVKSDNRIIATYRLLPTDRVLNAGLVPYSANEFDLTALLEMCEPRSTLELGRSCVHPSHRHGAVPKILWSALAKYMIENGRSDAFGSVSVFHAQHSQAAALVEHFKNQGAWSDTVQCPALVPVVGDPTERFADLKSVVPPLLRSYLMLGAKLYGGPSYDPAFRCHDFLIHFSTRTMSERCKRSLFGALS